MNIHSCSKAALLENGQIVSARERETDFKTKKEGGYLFSFAFPTRYPTHLHARPNAYVLQNQDGVNEFSLQT